MGLSSVATAWSSYQSALWGGLQSESFTKAAGLRVESSEASANASNLMAIDIAVFTSWVDAAGDGEERKADFYEARFRDEFAPAFEAWIASDPLSDPAAPATPFEVPEYRLASEVASDSLRAESDAVFELGRDANRTSDRYVLTLVLFATVLFLTGVTQTLHSPVGMALLVMAALIFVSGIFSLATLPRL